jgi:hypothetical protein
MARLRQRDAPRASAGHPGAGLGPAGAVGTPSPFCAPPRQDRPAHPGAAASLTRKAMRPAPPIQWASRSTSSSTGGQQDGGAAGQEILDLLPQVYGERGSGGRLVQNEHRRLAPGWRPGPAVPHAAGIDPHRPVGGVGQLELLEHPLGSLPPLGPARVVPLPDQREDLTPGQHLVGGRVLAGQPDRRPQRNGVPHDVQAGDPPGSPSTSPLGCRRWS